METNNKSTGETGMKTALVILAIIGFAFSAAAQDVVVTWDHDGVGLTPENCGDGTQCGFMITCALKADPTNILGRHSVKSASARQMVFEDINKFVPGIAYVFVGYAVNAFGQSTPSVPFEFTREGTPYYLPSDQGMTSIYSAPGTTVNVNVTCPACP